MRALYMLIVVLCGLGTAVAQVDRTNSIGMSFLRIEPGSFEMGVDSVPLPEKLIDGPFGVVYKRPGRDGDYDESPVHKVTIAGPLLISQTEVTIEQFRQFRPDYKASSYGAPYAAGVSWFDAMAFCKWLSAKEGVSYRLPTEAEWEFAARAGARTPFSSGNDPPEHETANAWGVKNMHSGVAEWCMDWHGMYTHEAETGPVGPATGIARVVRGGGLDYRQRNEHPGKFYPAEMAYYRRSANRASMSPHFASPDGNIGFRVVRAEMPATPPRVGAPLMFQTGIKQDRPDLRVGPDMTRPFYRTRQMFPNLGQRNMREIGWKLGLAPGLGVAYHNSAVAVCDNGDLIAAYYNTLEHENDPDQSVLVMRLRYGADDWDMPEPWPDFADAADAAPVFWNENGKLWFFFGSPRILGGPPFQFMTSSDNGASWSDAIVPMIEGKVGGFTAQPINSVVHTGDGTIYLPIDGEGNDTALFASRDGAQTWYDTGGRTAGRHTTFVLGKDGVSLIGFGGKNTDIEGVMPKSISRDGGKTYAVSKTPFPPLNSGQRPSVIRLASGRLFFVSDTYSSKPTRRAGCYVALSEDDGETWNKRDLPGVSTVGYVTAVQAPNGVIHIVTSKTNPHLHIELNEAWVQTGGPAADQGQFRFSGVQSAQYADGKMQWEATFENGRKVGTESFWSPGNQKKWERTYEGDGSWTWRVFAPGSNRVAAESRWKGKDLLEARFAN